ncbi:MAG: hypothetical protein R2733_06060 [Acidimicrobiales bacterium]
MNAGSLQYAVDRVVDASPQQWLLRITATCAAMAAMGAAGAAGIWSALGFVIVALLAALSSLRPDSHAVVVVDIIIIASLHAAIDDPATPWLPVAALCLTIHHTVTALAASIPIGGELPVSTLGRWVRQTAVVAACTLALWLAVVVLDRRDLPGSALLTAVALAVAAGVALLVRDGSIDESR